MKCKYTTPWCDSMLIGSFGYGLSGEDLESRLKTHIIASIVFAVSLVLSIEIWKSMGWIVVVWMACALTSAIICIASTGKYFDPPRRRRYEDNYGGFGALIVLISLIIGGALGPIYMLIRFVICCIDITQAAYEGTNGPYAIPKFRRSKLSEEQLSCIHDVQKHMEAALEGLRDNKDAWGGKTLVPFDFGKALEATAIFVGSIEECFQTKLAACLWTADYMFSAKTGCPITGFVYSKTDYGLWPKDLESLLELPIFTSRQILGKNHPYTVYDTVKRIGTSHLSFAELQVIAEVVNTLKNCSAAEAISYMDRPENQGQIVGFTKIEENITWLT